MSGMNSRNAIISVSNKEKVELLAGKLAEQGYTIYATKGTQSYLEKFSIISRSVEEISRTPEMFGGRVKTLSSFLLGGVLAEKRDDPEIMRNGITPIDLVYVELYPFREKFLAGEIDLVEDIDIGGVTLIRAAAKNHRRVIVIPGKNFIDLVLNNMRDGDIPEELRRKLAGAAFHLTSLYDYTISEWFGANDDTFMLGGEKFVDLRYGENPHQVAVLWTVCSVHKYVYFPLGVLLDVIQYQLPCPFFLVIIIFLILEILPNHGSCHSEIYGISLPESHYLDVITQRWDCFLEFSVDIMLCIKHGPFGFREWGKTDSKRCIVGE